MATLTRIVRQPNAMAQPGISLFDEDGRMILKIEGSARAEAAVFLQQNLAQTRIAHGVAIDWAEAEHVDACVLQVLLALRTLLAERGLSFLVDKDNARVRAYLKLSGLSDYFPVQDSAHQIPSPEGPNA